MIHDELALPFAVFFSLPFLCFTVLPQRFCCFIRYPGSLTRKALRPRSKYRLSPWGNRPNHLGLRRSANIDCLSQKHRPNHLGSSSAGRAAARCPGFFTPCSGRPWSSPRPGRWVLHPCICICSNCTHYFFLYMFQGDPSPIDSRSVPIGVCIHVFVFVLPHKSEEQRKDTTNGPTMAFAFMPLNLFQGVCIPFQRVRLTVGRCSSALASILCVCSYSCWPSCCGQRSNDAPATSRRRDEISHDEISRDETSNNEISNTAPPAPPELRCVQSRLRPVMHGGGPGPTEEMQRRLDGRLI